MLLRLVRKLIVCDIQENEGINRVITLIGQRCPCISKSLLDARVKTKYTLGMHTGGAHAKRWSERREKAQATLELCTSHLHLAKGVMSQTDRWAPVAPAEGLPPVTSSGLAYINPRLRLTPTRTWASAMNILWHRCFPRATVSSCFTIGNLRDCDEGFLLVDKSYFLGHLARCSIHAQIEPRSCFIVTVRVPFEFVTSVDLLTTAYERTHAEAVGGVEETDEGYPEIVDTRPQLMSHSLSWITASSSEVTLMDECVVQLRPLAKSPRTAGTASASHASGSTDAGADLVSAMETVESALEGGRDGKGKADIDAVENCLHEACSKLLAGKERVEEDVLAKLTL